MAKGIYTGVNGVARKVTQPYVGENAVARKVTSGYVGVNGVARQFFQGDKILGNLEVGASVYFNFNDSPFEGVVIQQGTPSADKYVNADGTWVWMVGGVADGFDGSGITARRWHYDSDFTSSNYRQLDYPDSEIHLGCLSDTYSTNLCRYFDTNLYSAMNSVTLPYTNVTYITEVDDQGNGSSYWGHRVSSGSNGVSTKLFLLSAGELNGSYEDGVQLQFFKNLPENFGVANYFWTRTKTYSTSPHRARIADGGSTFDVVNDQHANTYQYGIPAFVLPFDTQLDESNTIII